MHPPSTTELGCMCTTAEHGRGMRLAAGVMAGTGPGPYEDAQKPVSSFMAVSE